MEPSVFRRARNGATRLQRMRSCSGSIIALSMRSATARRKRGNWESHCGGVAHTNPGLTNRSSCCLTSTTKLGVTCFASDNLTRVFVNSVRISPTSRVSCWTVGATLERPISTNSKKSSALRIFSGTQSKARSRTACTISLRSALHDPIGTKSRHKRSISGIRRNNRRCIGS